MTDYYDLPLEEQIKWMDKARDMMLFQPGLYGKDMLKLEELAVRLYKKSKWIK